mmetsp:Transcript_39990/g.120500  ORF Transcript_39990/g.120500 Transcript_39990/m.120500 type:complete len:401 (-) Transcript_39990:31-1233(-)
MQAQRGALLPLPPPCVTVGGRRRFVSSLGEIPEGSAAFAPDNAVAVVALRTPDRIVLLRAAVAARAVVVVVVRSIVLLFLVVPEWSTARRRRRHDGRERREGRAILVIALGRVGHPTRNGRRLIRRRPRDLLLLRVRLDRLRLRRRRIKVEPQVRTRARPPYLVRVQILVPERRSFRSSRAAAAVPQAADAHVPPKAPRVESARHGEGGGADVGSILRRRRRRRTRRRFAVHPPLDAASAVGEGGERVDVHAVGVVVVVFVSAAVASPGGSGSNASRGGSHPEQGSHVDLRVDGMPPASASASEGRRQEVGGHPIPESAAVVSAGSGAAPFGGRRMERKGAQRQGGVALDEDVAHHGARGLRRLAARLLSPLRRRGLLCLRPDPGYVGATALPAPMVHVA